jgi:hypothetical protein
MRVRCAHVARGVRVARHPLCFPRDSATYKQNTKKIPIKSITYQLVWVCVTNLFDCVTERPKMGTTKRETPNQTRHGKLDLI